MLTDGICLIPNDFLCARGLQGLRQVKFSHEVLMKMNRSKHLPLLLGLAITTYLTGCSSSEDSSKGNTQTAPQFSFSSLEGKTVAMKDLANKVVVVDFWATWCPPCREEIPHLNKLYAELKGKGFEIVGISMDHEGTDVVKEFARELRIEYPIVMGDEEDAEAFGGIMGLPTTFIIDRSGNIVKKYVGLPPAGDMEQLIKELVG
jgi:cytochrome c biogenesis protein CcmG/thiol:disulfide interchange protein DsbE